VWAVRTSSYNFLPRGANVLNAGVKLFNDKLNLKSLPCKQINLHL